MKKEACIFFGLMAAVSAGACGSRGASVGPSEDQLEAVVQKVHTGDAWDGAVQTATDQLGAPHKVDDSRFIWAGLRGDDCHQLTLLRNDEGKVAAVGRGSVNKAMGPRYDHCAERARHKAN